MWEDIIKPLLVGGAILGGVLGIIYGLVIAPEWMGAIFFGVLFLVGSWLLGRVLLLGR